MGTDVPQEPWRFFVPIPDGSVVESLLADPGQEALTRSVDADSGGVAPADLIFVYGTRLPDTVMHAARLFMDGLAPTVVVTGGENRGRAGHIEAEVHARLLEEHGVPSETVVVENTSRSTLENVVHARPLVEARTGRPRLVIAVVKWSHPRAVLTLLNQMPSVSRVHAVTSTRTSPRPVRRSLETTGRRVRTRAGSPRSTSTCVDWPPRRASPRSSAGTAPGSAAPPQPAVLDGDPSRGEARRTLKGDGEDGRGCRGSTCSGVTSWTCGGSRAAW